jgi:hypothetical protein
VIATSIATFGNSYSTILVGANRVDLQKRWESIVAGIFIPLQLVAILAGTGLVGLVLVAQGGLLAQVMVNRHLAHRLTAGCIKTARSTPANQQIVRAMWPSSWRTAIGAIMSFGVAQGTAIAVANVLSAGEAASVQLVLRLMQIISQFSQAPFYTKIPQFNRLRARYHHDALVQIATRSMRLSLWIFVVGVLATDLLGRPGLILIGSQTRFPSEQFWILLAFAYFLERVGAMHVQLLLTSNKAIAHIANGITGAIWIACLLFLAPRFGAIALPISMLVAYAGFYTPWSAFMSHSALGADAAWSFERKTSLAPALVLVGYAVAMKFAS